MEVDKNLGSCRRENKQFELWIHRWLCLPTVMSQRISGLSFVIFIAVHNAVISHGMVIYLAVLSEQLKLQPCWNVCILCGLLFEKQPCRLAHASPSNDWRMLQTQLTGRLWEILTTIETMLPDLFLRV